MDAIFKRRSIRKYTEQTVPEELIDKILRAGMAAPSAVNEQPWHFVVIQDRAILDEIPKFHPYSKMLKEANVAIVVCGDTTGLHPHGSWVQDCSAATQNMLLMAQSLGLGSVWLGVYPGQDKVNPLKALINLPEHIVPLCIVSIGYPAESKEPANRYNPERIHRNRW